MHTLITKSANKVGIELLQILSAAVVPEIFPDNGNEFLGKCIDVSNSFFLTFMSSREEYTILKHKVSCREDTAFKEALLKWMAEHGAIRRLVHMKLTMKFINECFGTDNLSLYNMMYGKKGTQRNNIVFGKAAVSHVFDFVV